MTEFANTISQFAIDLIVFLVCKCYFYVVIESESERLLTLPSYKGIHPFFSSSSCMVSFLTLQLTLECGVGGGGSEEGVKGAGPLCSRKPACNFTAGPPYWQLPIYGFNQLQFKPMLFNVQLFYL